MSARAQRTKHRIAIDARMARHAGVGTYIRQLVPRITSALSSFEFTLVAPGHDDPTEWAEAPTGWTKDIQVVGAHSDIYSLRQHRELGSIGRSVGAHLWWVPHYDVPVSLGAPFVATVHDVAHLALRDMYGGLLRTNYARLMFGRVRRHARHIIFVSQFSQQEFLQYVGNPTGECSIIHNGVDERWRTSVDESVSPHDKPYLLFVGSVKPHKNVTALLAALERVAGDVPHDVVIVGATSGMRTGDPAAMRVPSSIAGRVHFAGLVDDVLLRQYMAHATALVLPSLYEGFGLPALEAMMAGCPCIVSSAASLPEVCGSAALYCDPRDPDDIARQIRRLVGDPALRDQLIAAGRDHASRFRWDRAAAATATILANAVDRATPPD